MSTIAATPTPSMSDIRRSDVVLPVVLLLMGLAAYYSVRAVFHLGGSTPLLATATMVFALVATIPFASVRYADLPRFIGVFVRWIGVAVLIQIIFDAVSFLPGIPNVLFGDGPGTIFFRYAAIVAIASGIIGWWRPAFLIAMFGFYTMFRFLIGDLTGLKVVKTDYMSMLDTGLFALVGTLLVIALCGPWLAARSRWVAQWHERVDVALVKKHSTLLIWSGAVGAHLANYFWSGFEKLASGWPEPWTWVLHNPTQTSILMGLERGDNLLWAFPGLLNFIWQVFVHFALPLNIMVISAQLLAPAAATSRRVLLTFTVFFDLFHVIVWFTLGAMFQYWVLVNLLIFASARHLTVARFTNPMRITMASATLLAPLFFYVNYLGWLDGAKLASPQFIAHTKDGRSALVPGPYFGIFSYNIAQGRVYAPDGAFPNWQAGNHRNIETWRDAIQCGPVRAAKQKQYASLEAVRKMVQRTDQFAREHPWYKNRNTYYYYPHHMLPNAYRFREFNSLPIEDIAYYTYRVDSVCLDLRDGRLHRDVRDRWEQVIPVAAGPVGGARS